ncbi:hypothetical protein A3H53_03705 [Candidatus Nomurabacteria bacterium RIFCSPLOWO2_02_FULL_40_10]|uniref:Uncharacterized protein n=1 Tax=Candidatus Nomurabacteria bacterium RIFCSPLOWO2_02_FULL_40_10 TaxID=1801786 RepID=A0A1F6XVR8_9BACT|nr:MAG: hypothetical protein A3H53_03705 [Candidatus Nomurabacteria bacterium RIFCSPLOWO2_02_FULL_40_10]
MSKIRNIIIFIVIGAALVLVYIFFIKPSDKGEAPSLVSSSPSAVTNTAVLADNSEIAQEFLTLLLSVRSIKLNDAIFSDKAFDALLETPVDLVQDGTEGRPNPFAPLGSDVIASENDAVAGANTKSPLTP